ncbi:ABC transporter substrate-binding protein [Paenibacillus methanolicus]|uniref:Raffinose/stachyose/melibiose transport system substrate-binding protein n=1 Tax=Paenibacillus methanolicus TaxID=582686 RepID=A0A5S5CJE1_9BACL|nr:extracellular solute-binding protein [Paenibacillus methanolicus]TYP79017.1 raffinose/stachyose/melibiose transport system substrate-binding protein [Paenibacillus methanolicus]
MRSWQAWSWMLLYSLLLAGAVLIVVSAKTEPIEQAPQEKIKLTFRHFWIKEHDRPILRIFEDAVAAYQLSRPDVKINFEGIDQTIHREHKLKSEMVAGTPPDIFVLFGGAEIVPYIRSNRLMDLTDVAREAGWAAQFKDTSQFSRDGRLYGLPLEGHAEPLFYNKRIFRELGLAAPSSVKQLDEAIARIKQAGYIPFALGNQDRWPAGIYAHYLMDGFAGSDQIEALAQGRQGSAFANEAYARAFRLLEDWTRRGAFPTAANELSGETAISLFTSGRAAMYVNGSWDITLLQDGDAPRAFRDEVGVLPFPSMEEGGEGDMAGGYTLGIALSSNLAGKQKEAAIELLRSIYTADIQSRLVYEGNRIPAMRIPVDSERTGPIFAQVMELVERDGLDFLAYDNVLAPEVNSAFLQIVAELLEGTAAPEEALRRLDAASGAYWRMIQGTSRAASPAKAVEEAAEEEAKE